MGTKARINIMIDGSRIMSMHQDHDGWPDGLGAELVAFASPFSLQHLFSDDKMGTTANGLCCFAAQLVGYLKTKIGQIYIRDTSDTSLGETFVYNLREEGNIIFMDVFKGWEATFGKAGDKESDMDKIYSGPAYKFETWLSEEYSADDE